MVTSGTLDFEEKNGNGNPAGAKSAKRAVPGRAE